MQYNVSIGSFVSELSKILQIKTSTDLSQGKQCHGKVPKIGINIY